MAARLSGVEEEVVILKAVNEIIDLIVNFEMLTLVGNDPESMIRLKSSTHQRFFNVVLVDFLSATNEGALVKRRPYLGALRDICEHPNLDAGSTAALRLATAEFVDWLAQKVSIHSHLPSIGVSASIQISREGFLKMCGNISKHNFLRLARVVEELRDTLAASGITELDDARLALGDVYEKFHTDFFDYHSSTIVEFLNHIRWGIYEYLRPQYQRSIVWEGGDPPKYHYEYPSGIVHRFARHCYWDLMNEVRSQPFVRRFQVAKRLKERY